MTAASGPLVLYVDDEQANRIVFEQSFARSFRVHTVGSGPEALTFMSQEPVAVLVTDQRMPEMSGHDLLVRVKEQFPDTVRIVVTAYSDLDAILQAVNLGLVARYIIKPWDRAELTEILKWATQLHELGRQDSSLLLRLMVNERLATLGSIAGAILHDLNQPLAVLELDSTRLQEHAATVAALEKLLTLAGAKLRAADRQSLGELVEELPSLATDVSASSKLMRGIVDGMRQFLRAERRQEPASTDPLPVIRTAMRLCGEAAVMARGRIVYDGPSKLPQVRIGATQLSQIFINLISNANQALSRRNRSGGTVVVHAVPTEGMVRFTVEDDGPGMTPEVLAKVGTRFFSTTEEGTGLGLAQCQRLIGSAGGELQVRSQPDKGAAVTFTLPCA
jgi:signal transduction histidine kinase